jgi:trans-aconitate methyltransferase
MVNDNGPRLVDECGVRRLIVTTAAEPMTTALPQDVLRGSRQARLQEDQYAFPYHHVAAWSENEFCHFRVHPPAYEYASYCRAVIERVAALNPDSILDVGCGDGKLTGELLRRLPHARVTGVDISETAIGFARLLVPDCQFVCGDMASCLPPGDRWEVAVLVEVLEHIEPAAAPEFVAAIASRLSDSGYLVLTVPSTNVRLSPKHYQHFDELRLAETVSPGFEIVEMAYMNRSFAWEAMFYRLMHNRLFVLSNRRLLSMLNRIYERHYAVGRPHNTRRLLAVCRKV